MEELPYDLSQALKESSKVVEQTVRRHNRKRRGKKRRSNPDLDFDLNEVDFPNRSDASSGCEGAAAGEEEKGGGGDQGGGGHGGTGGGSGGRASSGVAEHGSVDIMPVGSMAALTMAAAAGSSCSLCGSSGCSAAGAAAGSGSGVALPAVTDVLHHSGTNTSGRAAAAAAARSDSDDVHIAARMSALTLPPTAVLQLSCAAEAASAAATASATAPAASSKSAAGGAYGASASCGRTIKDLESDSVTEKSPVRPLNQRRRRRLRHMLVDEAAGIPVVPDAGGARAAIRNKLPAPAVLHGGRRTADFGIAPIAVSSSSSSNVLAQAGPVRQLWKRKRKQKMDTSEVLPGQATTSAASVADGDSGGEDERMQGELLSSELSSTSSEDERDPGRWSRHKDGAAYDAAQEGDDEQSDFFHEPGPAYGIPPGTAVAWWGKENKSSSSCDSRPTFAAAAAVSSLAGGSHSVCRVPPKDGFLAPFAGDERFSKHRLYSKVARRDASNEQMSLANASTRTMQLDRPFRIGRRRLKSATYRPAHDELGHFAAGSGSTARACSSLLVPSQLAQQLSQSSDIKRRRKTNLAAPFDEPSSTTISRSILIPHASTVSHTSKRANDGLSRASL